MLETSVLSIGVIKNDSIFKSGRQSKYFFLENLMEEWTSLLTVITAGKVWLELFEDIIFFIPFYIFFRPLIFSWKNLVK